MFYAYNCGHHAGYVSLKDAIEYADKHLVDYSEGNNLVDSNLEIYATYGTVATYGMTVTNCRYGKPILYRKLVADVVFKDNSEFSEDDIIRCSDCFGNTWCFGPWTYNGKAYRMADIDALVDMVDKDLDKATWYAVQKDEEDEDWDTGSYDFNSAKRIGNALCCARLVAVEAHGCERVNATAYYFHRDGSLHEPSDASMSSLAASLYDGGWRASEIDEIVLQYHLAQNEAVAIKSWLSRYEEDEDA